MSEKSLPPPSARATRGAVVPSSRRRVVPSRIPNYAALPTEQANPRLRTLDRLPTERLVAAITREDRRAAASVAAVRRPLARAVERVAGALAAGGPRRGTWGRPTGGPPAARRAAGPP